MVNSASIPNLAAVVSFCCNLINLNNEESVASNVVAILSDIDAKKDLWVKLTAVPASTNLFKLDSASSYLT